MRIKIPKKTGKRQVSLRTAISFVITALVLQYLLLEGSVMASTYQYIYSISTAPHPFKQSQYTINTYTIQMEVPETTKIQVTPDQGEEMQFNMYFIDSDLAFRGYIQVWKIKDLEFFLNNSKNLSPFDFTSYNMSHFQQNVDQGFQTEWSADFGDAFISGKEFWWSINNSKEVVRVSFFTDTADFPKSLDNVIQHILNSLKIAHT